MLFVYIWMLQIMENKTLRKLVRTRSEEILLVEHRRAHNICIELAGIRLPFPAIKVTLLLISYFLAVDVTARMHQF